MKDRGAERSCHASANKSIAGLLVASPAEKEFHRDTNGSSQRQVEQKDYRVHGLNIVEVFGCPDGPAPYQTEETNLAKRHTTTKLENVSDRRQSVCVLETVQIAVGKLTSRPELKPGSASVFVRAR